MEAEQMLKKANEPEPENLMYKLVYFGSIKCQQKRIPKIRSRFFTEFLETFSRKEA